MPRNRSRGYSTRQRSTGSRTQSRKPSIRTVGSSFKNKINSYQTLFRQTQGSRSGGPTPANLNTMAKWVDKGAVIQTVSNAQLKRWSKTNKQYKSPTQAKTALCKKFGKQPIKAVCPGKGNNWIVATSQTWKGKNFKFPR